MTNKTITKELKIFFKTSCEFKKNYILIFAIFRYLQLKFQKVNVHIYKCEFGNHYHVGRWTNKTKKKMRRLKRILSEKKINYIMKGC